MKKFYVFLLALAIGLVIFYYGKSRKMEVIEIIPETISCVSVTGPVDFNILEKGLRYQVFINKQFDNPFEMPTGGKEHFFGNNVTNIGFSLIGNQRYTKGHILLDRK